MEAPCLSILAAERVSIDDRLASGRVASRTWRDVCAKQRYDLRRQLLGVDLLRRPKRASQNYDVATTARRRF